MPTSLKRKTGTGSFWQMLSSASPLQPQVRKALGLLCDGQLGGQALHRAGSIKAVEAPGHGRACTGHRQESAIGPPWQSTSRSSRIDLLASTMAATSATQSSSDRAVRAPIDPLVVSPMWATMMSAPALSKQPCLLGVKGVRRGEQVELMGQGDAVDFPREAHTRLFQSQAKRSIDQADGRKILDPGKAEQPQLVQERLRRS